MSAPVLRTNRLVLRGWTLADREPWAAVNADAEVMHYLGPPLTRAAADAFVDRVTVGFATNGFGFWAVEVVGGPPFIGFVGLSRPGFEAHFTPCVEIGWRLARAAWHHGYASEAARVALAYGLDVIGLDQVVSFTTAGNRASRAVMERLGMIRDPADDFEHPALEAGDPLRPHVLYRLGRPTGPGD